MYDDACWFMGRRKKMRKRTKEEKSVGGALKKNGDRKWSEDCRISPLHWYIKLPSACSTSSHRSTDVDRNK
jgi:hypothetical protein